MIVELLLQGRRAGDSRPTLSGVEIHRVLLNMGVMAPSLSVITKEAYRLGIALKSGPRPGTPGLGRPRGPGKKFSKNRARVKELKAQGMQPTAIAVAIGISKQAVHQLLATDGDEEKKQ